MLFIPSRRFTPRTDTARIPGTLWLQQGVSLFSRRDVTGYQVLARIREFFTGKTAVEAGRDNPLLRTVVAKSALIYDQIPLRDYISEKTRVELGRHLFLEINGICNAVDPIMACRQRLAATMLAFSSWQVLVIPPAPEEDASGLRGQPGVTGELKERLVKIVKKNHDLSAEIYEATDSRSYDAVWEVVQRCYWKSFWYLGSFDAARIELNDVEEDCDWYRSFMHAACAAREHQYRWEQEMPPAFDEDIATQASVAFSMFTDIVLSGEKNPQAEWRDYHNDCNIPTPSFEPQTDPRLADT